VIAQGMSGSIMIVGYRVIISIYGFWLPDDPRGSRKI